jgi:type I restriction enzyme S subunit
VNPAQVLDHFDRISDAPDAIPRLRRFILDLAVRGKLVEQDPNDEPASELLKRTDAAKSDDVAFQVPNSWGWVRVGEIAECRLGKMLDKAKNKGTPRRYLRNVNVRWFDFDLSDVLEMRFEDSELDEFSIRSDDVLICEGGEPGRAAVWDEREADIYFQKAIHRVRFPKGFNPHYFVNFLRVNAESGRLAAYFTGVGIKHFTGKGLSSFLIPLPPLSEQHRIVAKVDELMALCDRLQAAQAERESRRDRLVAASLHRLNNGANADGFREHARFYLHQLPRVTTRVEHIQQLRQTILNLAVRGKLVAQDPNDEPAAELLKQIETEKARAVYAGEIKKVDNYQPVGKNELTFDVPSGWELTRMGFLASKLGAGSTPLGGKSVYQNEGVPFLRSQNVHNDGLRLDGVALISREIHERMSGTHVHQHDILLNITGASIGRCALVPRTFPEGNVSQHVAIIRLFLPAIREFIHLSLTSPFFQKVIHDVQVGVSREGLSMKTLRLFPMLLPPLAEQHRIVAKVEELLALFDRLEAQLTTTQTEGRRLLEAALHEALNGAV